MSKTVPLQATHSSISTQFSSIWPLDRTLSGATTPGQSEPKSNSSKAVLCIPQSSSIIRASPSDFVVSYIGHTLGESYPYAEMQSEYSVTPANWARDHSSTKNCKTTKKSSGDLKRRTVSQTFHACLFSTVNS